MDDKNDMEYRLEIEKELPESTKWPKSAKNFF